ncbi:MAG: hypothetical protein ACR2G0_11750 [Chthoniobacterales bacterium]
MKSSSHDEATSLRGVYLTGACVLIALVGMFLPKSKSDPRPAPAEKVTEEALLEKPSASTWDSSNEPRVTFAHTMPRAHGTQIFNNTGQPNMDMVMVAIPDGPKSVRFVRGSDPIAIRYVDAKRAEQDRLEMDRGPREVDTSEIANFGPLKGRTTRQVRNLAADPK